MSYQRESLLAFKTINDLKNNTTEIHNKLLFVTDQYTGGEFYFDDNDVTSVDDGATILVDSLNRRIKRIIKNDTFNVGWFTGKPYNFIGPEPDHTQQIQNCVNSLIRYSSNNGVKLRLLFPSGFYYISSTIDFSKHPDTLINYSGWSIDGVQSGSLITIPHGVIINGPMFNFNRGDGTISRNNIIRNLYFYSDSFNGKAKQCIDLSYNNRFGLYNVRTSRISTETDAAFNFCYEGIIEQCSFSGGKSINLPSDGLQLNDEANAILIIQTAVDNYIGNGTTISGSGIFFGSSKGLTVNTCTIQQCDYGITISGGSREVSIIGGGYFEGCHMADIRIGDGLGGDVQNTIIQGNSLRSQTGVNTNGLLIDKADIYGLICEGIGFYNDDAIRLIPKNDQKLQDIVFNNCRTGGTIFGFRNLINTSTDMYMDNIRVINPGTQLNSINLKQFTTMHSDETTEYASDFNLWTKLDASPILFLSENGFFQKSKVYEKNNIGVENIVFTINDLSGFHNQIVTFSCWIKFNGVINGNDFIQIVNQSSVALSAPRTLRPGNINTSDWVKVHVYGFVNDLDTSISVRIITRDISIFFSKPSLKIGFV